MARKDRIIPFRWLPGSWGLVGKPFQEAEAHYYWEGEDLDRRLAAIRYEEDSDEFKRETLRLDKLYGHVEGKEYDLRLATIENKGVINPYDELDIELKYGDIDQYEYDKRAAELDEYADETEKKLALLHVEFKHGKLKPLEYEKEAATLRDEPWVGTIDNGYNAEEGVNGFYFQLDWNDQWVEFLRKNGYHGFSDEQVVEQWFSDVCRSQVESTEPAEPIPFNSGRVINRIQRDGGTEYS